MSGRMTRNARTDLSIARSPQSSGLDLLRVVEKYPVEVLSNPALILVIMEDPANKMIVAKAWTTLSKKKFDEIASGLDSDELAEWLGWIMRYAGDHGVHGSIIAGPAIVSPGRPTHYFGHLREKDLDEKAAWHLDRLTSQIMYGKRAYDYADELLMKAGVTVVCTEAMARVRGLPNPWPTQEFKPNKRRRY